MPQLARLSAAVRVAYDAARDNVWYRDIEPKLAKVGLAWGNFQVMQRTHASLMRELGVDPNIVADQFGHSVDVETFDEFLEKRFPESRGKAYYLMAIHECLLRQAWRELKQVGWTKAAKLVKVARSDGQQFECATKPARCPKRSSRATMTWRVFLPFFRKSHGARPIRYS